MANASPTATAPTPGPWHVSVSQNPDVYNDEQHLCILPDIRTTHGKVIADIETLPEAEANARLIAAAPGLLRVVKKLRNTCMERLDLLRGPEQEWRDEDELKDMIGSYTLLLEDCDRVIAEVEDRVC